MLGALVALGAGLGIRQWEKTQDRSEKRDFLSYSNAQNYGYYLRSLRESPQAQREGLEAAGYNPMLALGSVGGMHYGGSSVASGDQSSGGDLISSAKQGSELYNSMSKRFENENDKIEAETDAIKASTARENKVVEATVKKTEQEIENLKQNQIESQKRTWVDNPIFGPVAGALGYKAAEKLGGLFGGSAKQVGTAPIVKMWNKAAASAARKAALKTIGSRALGSLGYGVPLLLSTVGAGLYGAADEGSKTETYKKRMKEVGFRSPFGLSVGY